MFLFAALVLLVMHLAIGLDSADRHDLAPGVLQTAFLFAGPSGSTGASPPRPRRWRSTG